MKSLFLSSGVEYGIFRFVLRMRRIVFCTSGTNDCTRSNEAILCGIQKGCEYELKVHDACAAPVVGFELKFFFNSAIRSVDGGDVASESVKEHIRSLVKGENKVRPCSDQDIVELLKKANINVARRTVAKYRESMGILPSRKRRNPY